MHRLKRSPVFQGENGDRNGSMNRNGNFNVHYVLGGVADGPCRLEDIKYTVECSREFGNEKSIT